MIWAHVLHYWPFPSVTGRSPLQRTGDTEFFLNWTNSWKIVELRRAVPMLHYRNDMCFLVIQNDVAIDDYGSCLPTRNSWIVKVWDEITYPFLKFNGEAVHPTLHNGCDCSSMLGLKFILVSKRGSRNSEKSYHLWTGHKIVLHTIATVIVYVYHFPLIQNEVHSYFYCPFSAHISPHLKHNWK